MKQKISANSGYKIVLLQDWRLWLAFFSSLNFRIIPRQLVLIALLTFLLSACRQSDLDLLDLSEKSIANNNYKDGIEACNKLLKRQKKVDLASFNRGRCYLGLNKYPESLRDFNKALGLIEPGMQMVFNRNSPLTQIRDKATASYTEILFYRAEAYYLMDSLNKSISDFNSCIEQNEQIGLCYIWIGNIYSRLNNRDLACDSYKKAMMYGEEQAFELMKVNCTISH